MNEIIIEPLRWMDLPARVKIVSNNDRPQAFLQITTPRDIETLCIGRPVEELPRIATILAPAHHLASAAALDALFRASPPETARNRREALRQALFFEHHLRKLFFLVSSRFNPLTVLKSRKGFGQPGPSSHPMLTDIMNHIDIAQEASVLFGGRYDHPVTSLAGGVSRSKDEENYGRLQHIAQSCKAFSLRLAEFMHETFFDNDREFAELQQFTVEPLNCLVLDDSHQKIGMFAPDSRLKQSFEADTLLPKIRFHHESWTYMPFAFFRDAGNEPALKESYGISDATYDQCFFVGPLARLNSGTRLAPPSEQERQLMISHLGEPPLFNTAAAFWSLLVEIIECAEIMTNLYLRDKIGGETLHNPPLEMGTEAGGVLESPQGLIFHHYKVDDQGKVLDAVIFDAAVMNNALRCIQTQRVVETSLAKNKSTSEIKQAVELTLLPHC